MSHFSSIIGADGDAKLWSDESTVDKVGHILKGLPVVLTGRQEGEPKLNATQRKIACL